MIRRTTEAAGILIALLPERDRTFRYARFQSRFDLAS
jgi:hypothetical protein